MKNILKFGIISFAFGLIFITADTANAQNRRGANREYREDVRDARQDYNRRVRNGDRRKAVKEYREDVRDARQEYVQNVRRSNNSWYYYQNGRRYDRPFASWTYNNGRFFRRY